MPPQPLNPTAVLWKSLGSRQADCDQAQSAMSEPLIAQNLRLHNARQLCLYSLLAWQRPAAGAHAPGAPA